MSRKQRRSRRTQQPTHDRQTPGTALVDAAADGGASSPGGPQGSVSGLRAKLADSKVAVNASVLLGAQVISRALTVVYAAALGRYVGPDGIGTIATATAVSGLLSLVIAPGLATLLVRDVAAQPSRAARYISNMMLTRVALGGVYLLLTAAVSRLLGYPVDTVTIVQVYAVVYFLDALGEVLASVFRAFERLEYEGGSQLLRDGVNIGLSLTAIALRQSLLTICLVSVLAQALKLVLMYVLVRVKFVRPRLDLNLSMSRSLLVSSLPFGALLVLAAIRFQFGTLVLSLNVDVGGVGNYSAALSLVTILILLPNAFLAATQPTFSRLYAHAAHDLPRFYELCYKYLFLLGLPLAMGTVLVGGHVIRLVYGDMFHEATAVIQVLAFTMATFAGYVSAAFLNMTGRQGVFVKVQAWSIAGYVLLCLVLIPRWGAIGAAVAFVVSEVVPYLILTEVSHRHLRLPLPWAMAGKVTAATLFMGVVASSMLAAGVPWLAVIFPLAPAAYGAACLLLGVVKRDEVRAIAGGRVSADAPQPSLP